jgi:hypothetical protein
MFFMRKTTALPSAAKRCRAVPTDPYCQKPFVNGHQLAALSASAEQAVGLNCRGAGGKFWGS